VNNVPKKQQNVPPDEQSKRFVEDAQRMIDAGELNPTEAEKAMDKLVRVSPISDSKSHQGCAEKPQPG
jgi:polyhydroxyalkanoate synthesis regulator phasin